MREAWIEPPYRPVVPIEDPRPLGSEFLEFTYTKRQKDWMERAFGNQYYSLGKTKWVPINGQQIEYHHITPCAWIIENYPSIDPNALDLRSGFMPIPLLRHEHLGIIHPDMQQAIRNYHKDPEAIKRTVHEHHQKARRGKVFWNNRHDAVMMTAVRKKLIEYMYKHPEDAYPEDVSFKKRLQ